MQGNILNDQCPICQYSFNPNEKISALCCGHAFHAKCLRESFQMGLQDEHQTCPICEKKLVESRNIEWGEGEMGSSNHIGIGLDNSEKELGGSNGNFGDDGLPGPFVEPDVDMDDAIGNTDEGEPDEDREGDVTGADL